jgi:hypothetical protein
VTRQPRGLCYAATIKNFDLDPTNVYTDTVMPRYAVSPLINDPQWDICLRQSRNAIQIFVSSNFFIYIGLLSMCRISQDTLAYMPKEAEEGVCIFLGQTSTSLLGRLVGQTQ